jgi:hypothetical protein
MPQSTTPPPPPGFVPEKRGIPAPPPGFVPETQEAYTPPKDYWGEHLAGKYEPTPPTSWERAKERVDKSLEYSNFYGLFKAPGKNKLDPKYWARIATPEYWKNVGKGIGGAVGSALVDPSSPAGIINSAKQKAEEYSAPGGPRKQTAAQEWLGAGEQVFNMLPPVFIVSTAKKMLEDPVGAFEEDPLAVVMVLTGFSGQAKKIYANAKSGKPIAPNGMKKIMPDLKKWSIKANEDAHFLKQTTDLAKVEIAKMEARGREVTAGPPIVGPEVPGAFNTPRRATGISPKAVSGPGVPEPPPGFVPEPTPPVAIPAEPIVGPKIKTTTPKPDITAPVKANHIRAIAKDQLAEGGITKAQHDSLMEEAAGMDYDYSRIGRGGTVKPLSITSEGMKMGLEEAELKGLFAGMPIDEKVLQYIKERKFIPSTIRNPATGQETKAPAKVVGVKGDWNPDFPKYTVQPDPAIPEPMLVEKTAGNKPNSMPGYRHELVELQKIKDIAPTKYKYQLENPIRWFDNSPFLKKELYYPWRTAEKNTEFEKHSTRMQVRVWEKSVPRPMQKELGDYAIAKQKNGPESLQLIGIDPASVIAKVESNPAMMKVYNEVRTNLEGMFVRINQAREVAGLSPLPKVENYFTFARDVNELEAIGHSVAQEKNPEMLKRHPYEPTFQYKKREGVIAPMNRKFYAIYEHYMNNAARYSNVAPVVAKGRVLLGDWGVKDSIGRESGSFSLGGAAPNLGRMTTEWVDRIAGKHIGADVWFSKVLRSIARNTGAAVISFNPRSAILQPTSLQNTYIEIGGKYLYKGIEGYALKERRQFAMRNSEVLTGRALDVNLEDLWADGVAKVISHGRARLSTIGSYPLKALDAMAAQISWLGGYERAITPELNGGLGLVGRDAIRYADDVVVRTQASAKIGDLARIQTTPLGKMASIFQTFVINNWNYWSKDVMGWKNPEMANVDRVKKITKLVLSSVLINTLFEDVIGINSPLPAPERQLVQGIKEGKTFQEIMVNMAKEISESVPIIGGSIKYTTRTRTSLPQGAQQIQDTARLGADLMESFSKWDLSKTTSQDLQTLSKFMGVPGAAELFKIQRMSKAGMPWWKILVSAPVPTKAEQDKIKMGEYIR